MSEALRIGVVGTGAMGGNHVRLLAELEHAELVGLYDRRPEVAARLATGHGTTRFDSVEALAEEVEALVIAVPTSDHATLGCSLLESGRHLLVEKPIAASLEEADRLLAAASPGTVLAVGHVEFFNPAVQALLELEEAVRYFEVQRLSPFTPRSLDVDVALDLMIHDLQILHAFDPSPVVEIRASGIEVLTDKVDMVSARIELESGAVANLSASRVAAEAVRKLRLFRERRYFSLDFREQEIKGFGLRQEGGERRIVPERLAVHRQEPLRAELAAFVAACRGEPARIVDGREGRRALATALAVRDAIEERAGR